MPKMVSVVKSGNTVKLVKNVLLSIIDREFISSFTYTGKTSSKQKKKFALKDLDNIIKLIYAVVSKLIGKYDYSSFEDHLINKVIKHAYTYSSE